jgi:nucleoside-diphosphate-sugar epimerase
MREAQRSGYFAYTDNHAWPACSYEDAAEAITLSILAGDGLENPANLHIVAETGVSHKVIAEALAERTGKKAKRIEEHGLEELGFLGKLMRLAYPVPSEYTRKATGWQPEGDGLVRAIMGYKLD